MPKKLLVTAQWDEEAGVWVATSDDIPGLVTESRTLDGLLQRVMAVTPELLEDNVHHLPARPKPGDVFEICILSQLTLHANHAA